MADAESGKKDRNAQAAMAAVQHYAAFISYSHADEEIAEWLHERLESYRIPAVLARGHARRSLGKLFRDRVELSAAHDLGEEIRKALEASDALIVLCSPRSAGSRYVEEEIRTFKALGRGERILAAIVDGEPHAAGKPGRDASEECFPRALLYRVGADGVLSGEPEPAEPIAADVRAGKDGRENGALKLIAGLLDVGLDELVQREKQAERRRRLRVRAVAALMGILALVAIAAGGFAWIQQGVAESRRVEAVEQRDSAEQATRQAVERLRDFETLDLARTALIHMDNVGSYTSWDAKGVQHPEPPDFTEPLREALEGASRYQNDPERAPDAVVEALRTAIEFTPPWAGVLRLAEMPLWVEWSRDGKTILTADREHEVRLWDSATNRMKSATKVELRDVLDFQLGFCGQRLLTPQWLVDPHGSTAAIPAPEKASFTSCDGTGDRWIATADNACLLSSSGPEGREWKPIEACGEGFGVRLSSWSGDDRYFVLANSREFRVVRTADLATTARQQGTFLGWSQEDQRIAYVGASGPVSAQVTDEGLVAVPSSASPGRFWIEPEVGILEPSNMGEYTPWHVSPDLKTIARSSGQCHMGNAGGGCSGISITVGPRTSTDGLVLFGHGGAPTQVAWSPDGEHLISAAGYAGMGRFYDTYALVWDISDHMLFPAGWDNAGFLPGLKPFDVRHLDTAPAGAKLVTAAELGPEAVSELDLPFAAEWTPSGDIWLSWTGGCMACRYQPGAVVSSLYRLKDKAWFGMFEVPHVRSFFEDEPSAANLEGTLSWPFEKRYIWQIPDGFDAGHPGRVEIIRADQKTIVLDHPALVVTARWSPDRTKVLTAAHDQRARVWDAATGRLLQTIPLGADIYSASWSPDGEWVLLYGGGLQIVPASLTLMLEIARSRFENAPTHNSNPGQ